MSINPFDDDNDSFCLINGEEQHSLWLAFADVPPAGGWLRRSGSRCVVWDYIEKNSTGNTAEDSAREAERGLRLK